MRREVAGRARAASAALTVALAACAAALPAFPWPGPAPRSSGAPASAAVGHAEVETLNAHYQRERSQVLVRAIRRPTRANLDYAAYHANFMNADQAPENARLAGAGARADASHAFAGALARETITGSIAATPLSEAERRHPLALAPLVELLASKHLPGAERLEEVVARVRAEDYGLGGGPQLARQTATEVYLHHAGGGAGIEYWIKVELAPWFQGFSAMPDEDGDGFPEIYARVADPAPGAESAAAAAALRAFIEDDYAGRELSPAEVKAWGHQLASYWYPSYNTDLLAAGDSWPDADTEPAIRGELGGQRFVRPAVVMRGKPQGQPVYNVFLISGAGSGTPPASTKAETASPLPALARSEPTPHPQPVAAAVRAELAAHGGSWSRWAAEVAPQHAAIKRRLKAEPAAAKAIAGSDGFLFFRPSLSYVVGGDLVQQRGDRNPLPVIVAFQRLLAENGVDFLFVPVPTKAEIFPDKIGLPAAAGVAAGQVLNPFERKFLLDLAERGVEVVDLLPLFLRERAAAETPLLYQRQDTHWTSRGLELAARAVAERVKRYPWYAALAGKGGAPATPYRVQSAEFTRHGDLHSRLPERDKARFNPETLVGHQVVGPGGGLYEDDETSPIVLLGDSFTGVFQLMDCEHAGVSAHLARELGRPVDLVMSYGGGPNVRQKLLRRGVGALARKKLVIWMMTARDLHDFWEGWQPLPAPRP
ncbi:MAG TPA: hypothetical protein VFH68_16915 [Polyangia bacterium]|nr:hypothetical protein [Polyangia bacterium]